MVLENLLLQNKTTILKRWFDLILESYPANTATMMRKDRNQFTNPVGATFSREIETLFKQLCEGGQKMESAGPLWMRFLKSGRFKIILLRKQWDLSSN
jgi:hypothetical protein